MIEDHQNNVKAAAKDAVAAARRTAQKREQLAADAVNGAEEAALHSAQERTRRVPRAKRKSGRITQYPLPSPDVNAEVKLLKSMASGKPLEEEELHVLAAMSIRHHEITRR